MAVPFFQQPQRTGGGLSQPGASQAGFQRPQYLDASLIQRVQSAGILLTPTSFTAGEFMQSGRVSATSLNVQGSSVPGYSDGTGNIYVIDERGVVYATSRSPISPTSGIPPGSPVRPNVTGTGGGVRPFPTGGGGGITGIPFDNGGIRPPSGGGPVVVTPPTMGPGSPLGSGNIYTAFTVDDIIPNQQEIVTRALWSNNVGSLTTFYTSSAMTTAQKEYYYEIWNSGSQAECGAQPQFSVSYGNKLGSGSADDGGQIEDTPSRAIYGQNRLLCLDQDEESFIIDGTATDSIYVINVNRARMREFLDEGNIEINLAHLSGSEFAISNPPAAYTGSNVGVSGDGAVLRLIDDSSLNAAVIKQGGEVYNIVSGSIEDGIYNSSNPEIYGLLFKRKGIIVLDATRLDASASFGTVTAREVNGDNSFKLHTAISGAALYNDGSGDPLGFAGRGGEKVKSTHFFVRAKNSHYNFSNNSTFITGSEGDLRHPDMINNPKTYITGIGLYNMNKELMAVAKTSQPIPKSFTQEALIKVKLDFVWIAGLISTLAFCI